MAVLHADIERLIAAADIDSTIVRPGMLASNVLFWWASAIRGDGVVRWIIGDVLGRRTTFEELSPEEFRSETEATWPRPVVDMLLDAWGATTGRPAFVTTTVSDVLGSTRSFREWVADHATAFDGPSGG
jgi:uncharacterized protein YbjT (DUF2867 family)